MVTIIKAFDLENLTTIMKAKVWVGGCFIITLEELNGSG